MKDAYISLFVLALLTCSVRAQDLLRAGFGEADVTPALEAKKPVYLAGFGKNRKATKVHDPLFARAVVLEHDKKKIAIVAVDVVGLFNEVAQNVRRQLPDFTYILVSSTHNHEGPDTMGLWGPNLFASGIDLDYMQKLEAGVVQAIKQADKSKVHARAAIGTAQAPELLHDGREPYVKHDELVALRFFDAKDKAVGIVVQWNCHPETLSSKNTEISADFVGYTVTHLSRKHQCPVVYLTGTVGGLMTSLHVEVKDGAGKPLADGTFAKTEHYGLLVGKLADKAIGDAKPVKLTPFEVRTRAFFLPIDNPLYVLGFNLGVLKREAFIWKGDPLKAEPILPSPSGRGAGDEGKLGVLPSPSGRGAGGEGKPKMDKKTKMCIRSEVGWLRLGDLEIAAIPGEIYPELVLSKVQDPPDKGADFPEAPIEPGIYDQLKSRHRMIVGLANDEIGYILPKRQWDEKPPFCYGRKRAQYGEENSLGPETAPILCEMFRSLVEKK